MHMYILQEGLVVGRSLTVSDFTHKKLMEGSTYAL